MQTIKIRRGLIWVIMAAVIIAFMPFVPGTGNADAAAKLKAPGTFYGKGTSKNKVSLRWSKVKGAKKYIVYRSGKKLKTVKRTSYTDVKVKKGKIYTYQVAAKNGKKSSSIKVRASKKGNVNKIKLSRTLISLADGKTVSLKASVSPSKKIVSKKVTWKSSAPGTASVTSKGKIKAVSAGSAVITARTVNGLTAKCRVGVDLTAGCKNGNYVGTVEDTGVYSFKGIPYAKSPTGKRRWKRAEAPSASSKTYDASQFGWTSLQNEWHSEPASYVNKKKNSNGKVQNSDEDCLTLNVWTKDLSGSRKPVMVYFHGGGFGWGGTSDPLYSGKYLVKEQSDVIMVSCNYRVGTMGFIDLKDVPGATDEYKESTELGLLDAEQSLRWIKENIASFGGDPDNVTIFGESAGGNLVSSLLVADSNYNGIADVDEENLFRNCAAHSGSLNLTYNYDEYEANDTAGLLRQAVADYKKMDVKDVDMDTLLGLTSEELYHLNTEVEIDEDGDNVADIYNMPLRGHYKDKDGKDLGLSVIPEDPFKALEDGAAKNVNLIVGTNQDEWRYWISEVYDEPILSLDHKDLMLSLGDFAELIVDPKIEEAKEAAEKAGNKEAESNVDKLIKMQTRDISYADTDGGVTSRSGSTYDGKEMWAATELANETGFRAPSIATAQAHSEYAAKHSDAKGSTYMYYFAKESDNFPWIGACHASELAYVMHNLGETGFSGTVNKGLADEMCQAWTNFARTGDPSSSKTKWTQYDTKDRNTMTMDFDKAGANEMKMISDPLGDEREMMEPFAYYYLK